MVPEAIYLIRWPEHWVGPGRYHESPTGGTVVKHLRLHCWPLGVNGQSPGWRNGWNLLDRVINLITYSYKRLRFGTGVQPLLWKRFNKTQSSDMFWWYDWHLLTDYASLQTRFWKPFCLKPRRLCLGAGKALQSRRGRHCHWDLFTSHSECVSTYRH